MLATIETATGWLPRNPDDPARGMITLLSVSDATTIVEAIPCWLDHTGRPCVPEGDQPIVDLITELVGPGPWARTHVPGASTPMLLFGRTAAYLTAASDQAARTAGWEPDSRGRKHSPVELNRTPMWLYDVSANDHATMMLSQLAIGSDLQLDADYCTDDNAQLLVPAAAPRWN